MTCGIYGIFDAYNHDCLYVGQSKHIEYRWKQHLKYLRSKNHKRKDFVVWFIHHACDVHALDFKILEKCDNNDAIKNFNEAKWFIILHPMFYGEEPSMNQRWSHSEETKDKISASLKDTYKNHDYIRNQKRVLCPECHKVMQLSMSKNQRFCSRKCYYKNRRRKFFSSDNYIEDIIAQHNNGSSLRDIAANYDVSHITIRNILIENDIR